jgi:hypothetical protein
MSAAKLAANRANAAKSTGPKSDAGKRRSARNSLKSGIYAHSVPVHHHVPGDVHAFLAKMGPNFRAWLNDTPSLVLLRLQHLLVQDALLADPLNPALQHASEFFCHHLMRAELQHYRTFSNVELNILADQIESIRHRILPAKPLAASATSPLPLPADPAPLCESKPISHSFQNETPPTNPSPLDPDWINV